MRIVFSNAFAQWTELVFVVLLVQILITQNDLYGWHCSLTFLPTYWSCITRCAVNKFCHKLHEEHYHCIGDFDKVFISRISYTWLGYKSAVSLGYRRISAWKQPAWKNVNSLKNNPLSHAVPITVDSFGRLTSWIAKDFWYWIIRFRSCKTEIFRIVIRSR